VKTFCVEKFWTNCSRVVFLLHHASLLSMICLRGSEEVPSEGIPTPKQGPGAEPPVDGQEVESLLSIFIREAKS